MQSKSLVDELREAAPLLSVGILTADLMSLGSELALIQEAGVRLVHFDVMDGCYCPTITVGPGFIKAVKTPLLKDVHLMIDDPLPKLEDFVAAGADMITVHIGSCRHIHRVLQRLGELASVNHPNRGILRGLALDPGVPLEAVAPLMDEVEMVVLLAVNPGWGGQKFIAATGQRLGQLRRMIREARKDILIGVDGGITRNNVAEVVRMGPDLIVTGSAVFDGKNPGGNATFMLDTVHRTAGESPHTDHA
ncbi:MAG: ribulose-phosphate 3-epimerase [Phycisphaerae bacterium]|nr:ribulose-phosphate 3-epimerase [Phycisphaerae bacterium]